MGKVVGERPRHCEKPAGGRGNPEQVQRLIDEIASLRSQ
jgi:hypothetical protein